MIVPSLGCAPLIPYTQCPGSLSAAACRCGVFRGKLKCWQVSSPSCLSKELKIGKVVSEPLQTLQVVHRDFKTSNILVDAEWNGIVADFGLARAMKSRGGGGCHEPLPPECTVVMGTFGYVAPEYARTGGLTISSEMTCFLLVNSMLRQSRGQD